ncbi:MAG: hypothetical protein AAF502_16425 [Bacteroidota bacterium]
MRGLSIFLFEWKHFIRSPFKVVALVLFVVAGLYGLHNGASLYHEQISEIGKINETIAEERQKYLDYYDEGKKGPEERPWIDITSPYWAMWYNNNYHFKTPSAAQVYNIGQAEQYGFYKRVTFWASPYDPDMTKELANPERLQTGTLDFTFTLLFLLPLLLLILLYNLKSLETEQGFMPLIEVQTTSSNIWLLSRAAFYVVLTFGLITGLLTYGATLTGVFSHSGTAFAQMLTNSIIYLIFWSAIYFFILRSGLSIMSNTLKMVGVWIVFAFIIPAIVHQVISIDKPANLMMDFIDAKRDKRQDLFDQPDSLFQAQLDVLFPEIVDSPVASDEKKRNQAMNRSAAGLVNEMMKESIAPIEADNNSKNKMIKASYLFNPVTFFQNRFNTICQTHYDDYQNYRTEIQTLIDKQIRTMVLDMWNDVKVDKPKFNEYHEMLKTE